LAVIEFKRGEREIEQVFTRQVKPAMREKEPSDAYVLGIFYDEGRLLLFHRRSSRYLRYDESLNQKGEDSQAGDLNLQYQDAYSFLPSFDELKRLVNRPALIDRSKRSIGDLDVIRSISSPQIKEALSKVLRALDKANLVNQRGYHVLIETLALKIFDEKRNEENLRTKLEFYVTDDEAAFTSLTERRAREFVARMKRMRDAAEVKYPKILGDDQIAWNNPNHIRAVVAVCSAFQDYSFARSEKSDLYQLVFYNFANSFKRDESAQFLTPLPVINFIVSVVNPRDGETIFDPCCGIADFLSLSFVHWQAGNEGGKFNDANIYGVDLDENMIILATLNMLLNGDGQAKLFHKPDKGSIMWKLPVDSTDLVALVPDLHRRGNWDEWPDQTKLLKFDVVLTNPPFGEDRAFRPTTAADRRLIECYETWWIARQITDDDEAAADSTSENGNKKRSPDSIDLGVVFLENAYRSLKEEGRLGIVLSNSIASINKWQKVREWLMERMRIVALFDLPANVFAETGVNTSILVAYKPKPADLTRLRTRSYEVFVRDIQKVGYERRTSKRNVIFLDRFRLDETTFETLQDRYGERVKDEEFSQTIADFRKWARSQEESLQRLFLTDM
jgi:type I restriction enzyme M protein